MMSKYSVKLRNSETLEYVEADNAHCMGNGALVFTIDGEEKNTDHLVKAYSAGIWDQVKKECCYNF